MILLRPTIEIGDFDNITTARYSIPTYWDIGKVYKRLILRVAKEKNIEIIDALMEVYQSFLVEKIENYNGSYYYEAPQNMLVDYMSGKLE